MFFLFWIEKILLIVKEKVGVLWSGDKPRLAAQGDDGLMAGRRAASLLILCGSDEVGLLRLWC